MVTFVQIDPLFTIDLSVPTHQAKGNEFWILELLAIGPDHILGVGMNGTWEGMTDNVAISLLMSPIFPTRSNKIKSPWSVMAAGRRPSITILTRTGGRPSLWLEP